jgi:hypothetical protein
MAGERIEKVLWPETAAGVWSFGKDPFSGSGRADGTPPYPQYRSDEVIKDGDAVVEVVHEPATAPVKFEPVPVRTTLTPVFTPDGDFLAVNVAEPGRPTVVIQGAEIAGMAAIPPKTGGDPRYLKLLDEMRELHIRKAADYGDQDNDDPLANIRHGAKLVRIPAWQGAMLRANDKVFRIEQYIKKGTLANEGVEDSLMDLAAYALLALVLFRESGGA